MLDGELVPLGEGFVPIDAPVTALTRAAALAPLLLDDRVVVSDRSAAWVWGWGPAPAAVQTCVSITARIPSPDRRRLRAREVVMDADERCPLGAVLITTPMRTLLDLARHDHEEGVVTLLAAGIRRHAVDRIALELTLARRPALSFSRLARSRLRAAMRESETGQPLLTR